MSNSRKLRPLAAAALALAGSSLAQQAVPTSPAATTAPAPMAATQARPDNSPGASKRCTNVIGDGMPTYVTLGKSVVIPLKARVARIVVSGQPAGRAAAAEPVGAAPVAPVPAAPAPAPVRAAPGTASDGIGDVEVMLLSPTDLFFRGKTAGSMNVILQNAEGVCFIKDIIVAVDSGALQSTLKDLMPEETGVKVRSADRALVLTGEVTSAMALDQVVNVATAYAVDAKRVVNMMRVAAPQQVMLEVKIAEVSKTLMDNFGLDFTRLTSSADGLSSRVISGIIGGGAGAFGRFSNNVNPAANINGAAAGAISNASTAAGASLSTIGRRATLLGIDAQKKDGLIRVLAEPNIMAISGQQASFLSGGKIFIPVARDTSGGGVTITLEEKEFGIGVKFTPTVLSGGRVNLKMVSEVSDLSQVGSPFTSVNGVTSVLPSLTVRRADTTVQLGDGQSFVIAGLIKNNITETIKRFPGLGEMPVVGALARSNEFQTDQTELLFVVTPRLVKPLPEAPRLPTDNHVPPSRAEIFFNGALESSQPPADAPPPQPK